MYYISQPPGFSLEEHIRLLEEMYSQCYEDGTDAIVMADIWNQIQALHEKFDRQKAFLRIKGAPQKQSVHLPKT